ncbi:MAG: DUF1700 domain-containing protein [Lachnospiraceae bacterium]|nr:DUF1700 domain-containing protein [Lachnospiraceae bacterium]
MSKREFLEELRIALAGRVSAQEVTEHVQYYEDYINTQVRMGKSEAEVVMGLGEPRLLARNIAESKKYASGGNARTYKETGSNAYGSAGYNNAGYNNTGRDTYQNTQGGSYGQNVAGKKSHVGLIIALVVFVFLFLVFGLIFSVLSFLAPVLLPIILVLLLVRIITKNT